jgi:hypothetical protein
MGMDRMSQPYQQPAQRKGMVCHWCQWNPDGTIRAARYRPMREAMAAAEVIDDREPRRRLL